MKLWFLFLIAGAISLVSCKTKLIYYVDHDFTNIENQDLKDICEANEDFVNHLSKKYDLNRRFCFDTIHRVSSLSYVPRPDEEKTEMAIYINSDSSRVPEYISSSMVISIPYTKIHRPSIHFHEYAHRLTTTNDHLIGSYSDELWTLGDICTINKGCLNLMNDNYSTPFSFLLTKSQHEVFKSKETQVCTDTHSYPKDLVSENFEDLVTCCPNGSNNLQHSDIATYLNISLVEERDYITNLMTQLNTLITNNICPIMRAEDQLLEAQNLIVSFSRTSGTLPSDIDANYYSKNEVLAHIARIAKLEYLNNPFILNLYKKESEYLTPEGYDPNITLNNRLYDVYHDYYNQQMELEDILSVKHPNFDLLKSFVDNNKIIAHKKPEKNRFSGIISFFKGLIGK